MTEEKNFEMNELNEQALEETYTALYIMTALPA